MARPAFTVLELIVVLSVFAIVVAVTLPFLGRFQQRQTLHSVTQDVMQTLRRAQHKSMIGEGDAPWGVWLGTGFTVLYAGQGYGERNVRLDERHTVARTFRFGGARDVRFAPVSGMRISSGDTITISHPEAGESAIGVNEAGAVLQLR